MNSDDRFELGNLIAPISVELQKVEEALLSDSDTGLSSIRSMNRYVHSSGGKRLRPALLLSVSRMLNGDRDTALELAVIIESIHAATLVHDDVIDESDKRRGRKSLNALHQNKEAVLFGDWLYMTSFWNTLNLKDFRFLETLIGVTRQMVEGELLQMEMASQPEITAEIRERITFCKTAGLFGGCCQLGAQSSRVDAKVITGFSKYGESLGMCFQLVDDMLDYTAREEALGKPVLKDLEEGNITLPIIYLLEEADENERSFIQEVIMGKAPGQEAKNRILELIGGYGCLERAAEKAETYAAQAREALGDLPLSTEDMALLQGLPGWIMNRSC